MVIFTRLVFGNSLNPLGTIISSIIENAPIFRHAQAPRIARTAPLPGTGITQHGLVIDKKVGQPIVAVKRILTGPAIVTNVFGWQTSGEPGRVAGSVRAVVLEAFVPIGKEAIHLRRGNGGLEQERKRGEKDKDGKLDHVGGRVGRESESEKRELTARQDYGNVSCPP